MISPAQIPYYNQQEKRDKFMYRQRSITWFQASAVVISSIIGGGVLDIPRIAAATADSGAPLITLAGIAIALLGIWLITVLGMRFPKENLFQYSQHILGKPVAYSVNLCMVLFFVILTALTVRQFGEVVVSAVLRKTPIEVTIIILLLLATVTTRRNIIRFSYIHMFYLPFILGPVLGIALISLQNAEVLNLQPIIGNHPKDVIGGGLSITALFQSSLIITLIIPFMKKPEKSLRSSMLGGTIAGLLYFIIVISTVAAFGPQETIQLIWPTLEIARLTSLPGKIFERLDAIFIAVLVITVFTTIYATYYLASYAARETFGLKDHGFLSSFLLPFLYLVAMIPQDIFQLYRMGEIVGKVGLSLTLGYPLLLWIIAVIRKIRGNPVEE
ncbi:GerAB/ArcD/ProY family transporter [Paenibacillus sp. Dod16]|nr:endospore germination permease [Paenibacillus sp. LC231]